MAEYNSYKRGSFRAARNGRKQRNIALFALDDKKIITENWLNYFTKIVIRENEKSPESLLSDLRGDFVVRVIGHLYATTAFGGQP